QEVVARSHYRGKLKRRAMIGFASDDGSQTAVGTDIYDAEGSPVGIIANQTKLSKQAYIFLFETRLDALENEDGLFIDEEAKTKLDWKSVPYSLEKPEIE